MCRKVVFYHVTSGLKVMRDVHWCSTVFYQQIENCNIANQIHAFTIDYGKFILIKNITRIGWILHVLDVFFPPSTNNANNWRHDKSEITYISHGSFGAQDRWIARSV